MLNFASTGLKYLFSILKGGGRIIRGSLLVIYLHSSGSNEAWLHEKAAWQKNPMPTW